MAIVGPEYTFLCVDIGGYGKNSDGRIFEESNMGRRFAAGLMNVPPDRNLPGTNINVPHVLIGDEAFALKPTLMRPYPYRQSRGNKRKEEYNTRLCTARRVVENAFGILAQKWRIFHRPIETSVDTTIKIVRSTCILHNFIRTKITCFMNPYKKNIFCAYYMYKKLKKTEKRGRLWIHPILENRE
nr:unnamed protein product [Callosobruchus analis]